MKLLIFLSFVSFHCFAQESEPQFGLYFGNDFKDDSVSILVNGVTIAKNIKLRSTAISPQNLIIIQDKSGLNVRPHWAKKRVFKKLPIKDSNLSLCIQMNGKWSNFKFDLRKGKYLFVGYWYFSLGWSIYKVLTINQKISGPIMM
jgi:hypothetical protein